MKFLQCPILYDDESLFSYLARTSLANSYELFATFKSVIFTDAGLSRTDDVLAAPRGLNTYTSLSKLLNIPISTIINHTVHRFSDIFLPMKNQQPMLALPDATIFNLLDSEAIRKNCRPVEKSLFCPECLQEGAYHRLKWQLLTSTICSKHKTLLRDKCVDCGHYISILGIVNQHCSRCGSELSKQSSKDVSKDLIALLVQDILDGWMGLSKPIKTIDDVPNTILFSVFFGLKTTLQLKQFKTKKYVIDNFNQNETRGKTLWLQSITILNDLNIQAMKTLLEFPNGLYQFWDNYHDKKIEGCISHGLGNLYFGYIDRRWLGLDYDFLQNAYNRYIIERESTLTTKILKSKRIRRHPELVSKFSFATYAAAAKLLDVHLLTLDRWVDEGVFSKVIIQDKEYYRVLYNSELQLEHQANEKTINLSTAVEMLGLSAVVIKSLVDNGVLKIKEKSGESKTTHWKITKMSVYMLLADLSKAALLVENPRPENVKSFPFLLKQIRAWSVNYSEVIRMIINGKIDVYFDKHEPRNFQYAKLPADTDLRIRRQIMHRNGWLSSEEFAQRLGVGNQTFFQLVQAGKIRPEKILGTNKVFSEKSVINYNGSDK